MDVFRLRLNSIDHYQAVPSKFDPILRSDVMRSQLRNEPNVPIIRVFGATETGQKVCAHIHGAFPYLYVEYTGRLTSDEVGNCIQRLHHSIDYALAVSYRLNMNENTSKFVARITLVKGVPFYGFYVGYKYFLKIYMLNPMVMTRLSDILRQGAVMNRVFQPYEGHLQYLLQWMVDYNLYGCAFINCRHVTYRTQLPDSEDIDKRPNLWYDHSMSQGMVKEENKLPITSYCSLEVDICVQDILNRLEIKPRPLHHDFIERLNPLASTEKLVPSLAALWREETRRRKAHMSDPGLGSSPFSPEAMMTMSANSRFSQAGGWIHEKVYREKIEALILEEKGENKEINLTFEEFVKPSPFEATVKTALEAVEDLYPENLQPQLGLKPCAIIDPEERDNTEVDEKQILSWIQDWGESSSCESDDNIKEKVYPPHRVWETSSQRIAYPSEIKTDNLPDLPCQSGSIREIGKTEDNIHIKNPIKPHFLIDRLMSAKPGDINTQEFHLASPNLECQKDKNLKRNRSELLSENSDKRQRKLVDRDYRQISPSEESHCLYIPEPKREFTKNDTSTTKAQAESTNKLISKRISRSKVSTLSTSASHKQRTLFKVKEKFEGLPFHFPVVKVPYGLSSSHENKSHGLLPSRSNRISPNLFPPSLRKPVSLQLSNLASRDSRTLVSPLLSVMEDMGHRFGDCHPPKLFAYHELPPSKSDVISSMQTFKLPSIIYQDAFYSDELDVPENAREWAGREFSLESLSVPFLPKFDPNGGLGMKYGKQDNASSAGSRDDSFYKECRRLCGLRSWSIADPPPTYQDVCDWLLKENTGAKKNKSPGSLFKKPVFSNFKRKLSQIEGPTPKNKHGFKYTQLEKVSNLIHESLFMSIMSLEIHVNTRGELAPNPEEDEVQGLFWCLSTDEESQQNCIGTSNNLCLGIVVLSDDELLAKKIAKQVPVEVQKETSELDLMIRMVEIIRRYDPDILTGYEVHCSSWGYLIQRARLKYDYDLCIEFSRIRNFSPGKFCKEKDKWSLEKYSAIQVTGRHIINIWRAMRTELNLLQYTMENVVFHLLHRRIPHFTWADLTRWFSNNKPRDLTKVINYYLSRVQLDFEILERNELIERTSEQARLLGVDFFSVISRGSQYKVESLMFRIAKPENFILASPSRKQVGSQNALECLPLVMEPQSAFYNSPLLVLDFQSLYPSVMIAYNYCYSTFLGRIDNWRGTNKMGFAELKRQQGLLELLKDYINVSPNGMMYTKPKIRKSLLSKMLGEILETRVMIKSSMKIDRDDKALQRLLNNRQLALKLIANVTYGYTSASFSGRMPCSEIADSIVQTGRELLEKSIALIHSVKRWDAEVVYGDTDSLFVYLKGRTKSQAFDIGEEIAETITKMSPRPIKLKFEKVYLPCILVAKKRYVGFKYESRNQLEPDFDAKGIETVRRDGTPVEQKIEERALKILLRTSDLSQVKSYFQSQCEKIMKGSVSIQDFCFAKEVKLGTYSDKGPPPPGALISSKKMLNGSRTELQYGERVPYVVITGPPGSRLMDRCVDPEELLQNSHQELDSEYYISKHLIPPLERIFNLVGANVRNWYEEMPKVQRARRVEVGEGQSKNLTANKKTLESYMRPSSCLVCRKKLETEGSICPGCLADQSKSLFSLRQRLSAAETKFLNLQKICQSCSEISPLDEVRCDSKDCSVFYTRTRHQAYLKSEKSVVEPLINDLAGLILNKPGLDW